MAIYFKRVGVVLSYRWLCILISEWHVSSQIQLQNTSTLIPTKNVVVLGVTGLILICHRKKQNKLQDRIDNANNFFNN